MIPVCDVAIEYAHCRLLGGGTYDDPRELAVSARYAVWLQDALTRSGLTTTVQVLVDDKSVPDGDSEAAFEALLNACEHELRPDCVVLESGLVNLLEQFSAEILSTVGGRRAQRAITRYRERHGGTLACSHDVALWHALRMGKLDPAPLATSSARLGMILTGELRPCRVAVSILPRHDEAAETTADRELLTRVASIDIASQVLRYYFPDDATEAEVCSAAWNEFVHTVECGVKSSVMNAHCSWDEFDAQCYFEHNYASLRNDDRQIVEILRDFFRSCDIPTGARGIDVGSGTNLYPALAMLPFCEQVTMWEYSSSNVDWLRREVHRCSPPWHQIWQVLAKEAPYDTVEEFTALLASRVRIKPGSVFELPRRHWDVGTMCFVAESISGNKGEFLAASQTFLRSLRAGAPFVVTFMKNSKGYHTGKRWYPAVAVDESDVERCLNGIAESVTVRLIEVDNPPLREGYNGMIVAFGLAA